MANSAKYACSICGDEFTSRNKLFVHLKETDENHTSSSSKATDSPPHKRRKSEDETEPVDKGIKIVCEDDWYRVISKPQGLATMGGTGVTVWKSDQMLLPGAIELELRYKKASPCHRLDKETGGVMVCSKSKLAERIITSSFKHKLIRKKYTAIVIGKLEPAQGIIDEPLSGKASVTKYCVTHYTRSSQYEWLSTVMLWPVTGRKHQLRRHLQFAGHCIVGDKRYSMPQLWSKVTKTNIPHMCLWAVEVDFPHPKHCTDLVSGGDTDPQQLEQQQQAPELLEGSDDEDNDSQEGVSSKNDDANRAAERVRALDSTYRVVASIPEPSYYADIRQIHMRAWEDCAQKAMEASIQKQNSIV